jgi:ribosomal protein L29
MHMNEIPDAEIILEGQTLDVLAKVRQTIANDMTVKFEETYEPPHESNVSYWGEAFVELIGTYTKGPKIVVLAWVEHWDFAEQAAEDLWNKLTERLYEELTNRIPDLKWYLLEIRLLDSTEGLEKAAFLSQDFP